MTRRGMLVIALCALVLPLGPLAHGQTADPYATEEPTGDTSPSETTDPGGDATETEAEPTASAEATASETADPAATESEPDASEGTEEPTDDPVADPEPSTEPEPEPSGGDDGDAQTDQAGTQCDDGSGVSSTSTAETTGGVSEGGTGSDVAAAQEGSPEECPSEPGFVLTPIEPDDDATGDTAGDDTGDEELFAQAEDPMAGDAGASVPAPTRVDTGAGWLAGVRTASANPIVPLAAVVALALALGVGFAVRPGGRPRA